MNRQHLFVILVGAIFIAALASGPIISDAQFSPIPTETFTPIPSPPTDTPTSFGPTNTPPPPTNTPVPIPLPPELGPITIDPPEALVAVNVPLAFTLNFTQPLPVAITVTWDWGDGTESRCPPSSEDCALDPGIGMVGTLSGSHAYDLPGVYRVQVAVTDINGQFDTATYEFVTIYDPAAGFVTGNGWIDSSRGDYKLDPTLAGKATFDFASRYKQGGNRTTGNTVFQFKVGDLNFHSDTYHWLVVNQGGTNAQFKGEGTINGHRDPNGNGYKFMIYARDARPDTFRIRIWWEDEWGFTETEIYDNGFRQPIGSGNIVIHH